MARVKEFGATGDGKTDDTEAVQHAVDQGDGVLELPKGTFRITRPIVLDLTRRGYLGVRGNQGTSRLLMDGPGPALKIIGDHQGTATPSSVKPHTLEKERFPIISGFEILGNHEQADGIHLFRTMQTTVQNVLIRQCRHGIHLAERNRNFLLSASHIYDCHDTGVFFDHCNLHQVIITGNHISYCQRAGIRQINGDVHNIQITGNDIEYNSGAEGTSGEIVLEAPSGIISEFTISSNTLQATREASGANVLILGREEDPPTSVRLINITGNVLGSRDQNVVVNNASKVSITGNTIYGGTELNVALQNCENAVIGSNTIGTRPTSYQSTTMDGIVLERCRGCLVFANIIPDCRREAAVTIRNCSAIGVSTNQILNPHFRGVDVIDSSHCRISDNTVLDDRDEKKMVVAIRVTGDSKQAVIQHNTISKGKNTAIECPERCGNAIGNTEWD